MVGAMGRDTKPKTYILLKCECYGGKKIATDGKPEDMKQLWKKLPLGIP